MKEFICIGGVEYGEEEEGEEAQKVKEERLLQLSRIRGGEKKCGGK